MTDEARARELLAKVAALEQERDELIEALGKQQLKTRTLVEALKSLTEKLVAVHADPAYKNVWEVAWLHGIMYSGLTYDEELKQAQHAIQQVEGLK